MTHTQQYLDQARQMQALSLTVHLPLVLERCDQGP
jgi:hypothetical protein